MITGVTAENAGLLADATRHFRGVERAAEFASLAYTIAFVAQEDGAVAGYCWGYHLARPDGASMVYVHEVEVDPQLRRRGIGRRLMLAMLGAATERHATKLFLSTGSGNAAARRLYESLGGRVADQGETTNYWWSLERHGAG